MLGLHHELIRYRFRFSSSTSGYGIDWKWLGRLWILCYLVGGISIMYKVLNHEQYGVLVNTNPIDSRVLKYNLVQCHYIICNICIDIFIYVYIPMVPAVPSERKYDWGIFFRGLSQFLLRQCSDPQPFFGHGVLHGSWVTSRCPPGPLFAGHGEPQHDS